MQPVPIGLAAAFVWTALVASALGQGSGSPAGSGDWPQWGRTPARNMAGDATGLPAEFQPGEIKDDGQVDMTTTRNVKWVAKLGSQTYGNPTVAGGRIYIGTNNQGRGDPRFKGDASLLECLDAATGKTIWTLTIPKLGSGKVGDWEFLGLCSSPAVVGNRVYIITNRCEVLCADVNGLADGNQGVQDEGQYMSYLGTQRKPPVEVKPTDADIIWRYDMREELGVYPHNITSSSALVVGDRIYCSTSNGVTYDHRAIPSPRSPALIVLDRKKAEEPDAKPEDILLGEEASGLSERAFHGNWTSPGHGEIDGRGVILYGGPDGRCYAFEPVPVQGPEGFPMLKEKWRYDCNPRHYRFKDVMKKEPIRYARPEGPSEVIATPVFYKGRVYVSIGQDPEHGQGVGNLSCIDVATGGKVWDRRINRSISTCSIAEDLVYVADYSGYLYCLDAATGTLHWRYDTMSPVWGSTLVADGKVYLGNEDGLMTVIMTREMKALADRFGQGIEIQKKKGRLLITMADKKTTEISGDEVKRYLHEADFGSAIYLTPVVAEGVLYIGTATHLYAIEKKKAGGR